ncbi:hypothetical protein [Rhodosalinus sp.]|uniref:hypothetical protein n=1 Tax=Rhodosalinus sp. TaxID=2047741 RepID=UPI003566E0ED
MLRIAAALGLCALPAVVMADAGRTVAGTWTLEQGPAAADYRLASRGVSGEFLICFDSGNVRRVAVAVGEERSVLARGACTVFAPSDDAGIDLGFAEGEGTQEHGVAVGSFRVILPPEE